MTANKTLNFYVTDDNSVSPISMQKSVWAANRCTLPIHSDAPGGLTTKTYEEVVAVVEKHFGTPLMYNNLSAFTKWRSSDKTTFVGTCYVGDSFFVELLYTTHWSGGASHFRADVYFTGSPVSFNAAFEELRAMVIENPPAKSGTVYMLMMGQEGPQFKSLPNRVESTFIPDNYEPKVLEGFNRIKADLESDKPHGRIGILDGPPGTGKTHLVRGLLTTVSGEDVNFVFVSPKDVAHLADPSFLPALVNAFSFRLSPVHLHNNNLI